MEKNNLGLGVLILVGVLLVIAVFSLSSSLSSSLVSLTGVVKDGVLRTLGAIPGTSIDGNFFTVGGVERFYARTETATSSVVCSITNPWSGTNGYGTSTIDRITVKFLGGHSAAFNASLSTSTSAVGSSTVALVPEFSVVAGAQASMIWTPRFGTSTVNQNTLLWETPDSASDSTVTFVSPFFLRGGEEINVRVATGTPGTEKIKAVCNYELTKL